MTYQASLYVNHDVQMAHRLMLLPGKCQKIHGHSLNVELSLQGHINPRTGILADLDFGAVKKLFREYLDKTFDHNLHLNRQDPLAGQLVYLETTDLLPDGGFLPGLTCWPGDPTTENFAKWICEHMYDIYHMPVRIAIQETCTNGATYELG